MTRSYRPSRCGAMAVIRPSSIATSPSTTSRRSFMVTTMPERRRVVDTLFLAGELRRRPLHRRGMRLAVLHRDQLGEDADGDLLRRDGADVETDWRMHARQQRRIHALFDQRVVDTRDLGAAADQPQVSQFAGR